MYNRCVIYYFHFRLCIENKIFNLILNITQKIVCMFKPGKTY